MTKETITKSTLQEKNDGIINGISIASFLQMLEQESHTCCVHVLSEDKKGLLYFDDGILIDAEHDDLSGEKAAYTIVSWESPSIALNETSVRPRKIELSLGHILLNAAQQHDELTEPMTSKHSIKYLSNEAKTDKDIQNSVNCLSAIEGIRYFYLLNKTGKIVVHSAPNSELGELLIYCIITSSNLRKSLNVKSPRRIHMQMKDGSSLLIIPRSGIIIGMILEEHSTIEEIASQIRTGLSTK